MVNYMELIEGIKQHPPMSHVKNMQYIDTHRYSFPTKCACVSFVCQIDSRKIRKWIRFPYQGLEKSRLASHGNSTEGTLNMTLLLSSILSPFTCSKPRISKLHGVWCCFISHSMFHPSRKDRFLLENGSNQRNLFVRAPHFIMPLQGLVCAAQGMN